MTPKKDFKNNPAVQFISATEDPERSATAEDTEKSEAPGEGERKENITRADLSGTVPPGFKINPLYIESKSKRVNILMQPSLHEKLKKVAALSGKSFNEYVHSTLSAAAERDLNTKGENK